MNKKGTSVVMGFFIIFLSFMGSILLGVAVLSFGLVNDVLSENVSVGQVNLKEISEATFGKINTGLVKNADTIGTIFLFGMILTMILNGFFIGSSNPKLFLIIDIFLLILYFIPAIYVSQVYELLINSTPMFTDVFINTLPKVSKFMLNLPSIIASAGVITMILSYSGLKKDVEDEPNVLGF